MRKLYVLFIVILFISGCASIQVVSTTKHRVGQSIEFDKIATANVGDVIFTQYNYFSIDGLIITESFSKRVRLSLVEVPAGTFLYEVLIDGTQAFCTQNLTYIDPLFGPSDISCYFDNNHDNRFETLWLKPAYTYAISPPIPYKITEIETHSKGFKYELLYNGISENIVRLTYREFIDDTIRPAFQQELSYTINKNEPTTISFRAVQIEVISADNNKISYRVLTGFKSPD